MKNWDSDIKVKTNNSGFPTVSSLFQCRLRECFGREELLTKLETIFRLIHNQEEQGALEEQVKQATETAFAAMTDNSELGQVMQFIQATYEVKTEEELMQQVFHCCRHLGLGASAQIRHKDQEKTFDAVGQATPLTEELMAMLRTHGRIYDFKPRMQINYPRFSLLVKNMPMDEQKAGRYRDHLCIIAASVDARLDTLHTEAVLISEQHAIEDAVKRMHERLADLVQAMSLSFEASANVLHELMQELEARIPHLGLEEDQEQYILGRVDDAVQLSMMHCDVVADIHRAFDDVIRDLEKLTP